MSQVPPKDTSEQEPRRDPEGRQGGKNNPNSPSPDIAALIQAIKYEGRANRREEKREDRGKRLRELVTIGLIFLTLIVFGWQLRETIKAYGPLKDQAAAAKDTAIASARAWVGPYQARLIAPLPQPSIEKDWNIEIDYQNTGREPARKFSVYFEPFIEPMDEPGAVLVTRIEKYVSECKARHPTDPAEVIYPVSVGLSGGGYQRTVTFEKAKLDQALLLGDSAAIVFGCFVYVTHDAPKHSTFCYFFREGFTKPEALNICFGADAD